MPADFFVAFSVYVSFDVSNFTLISISPAFRALYKPAPPLKSEAPKIRLFNKFPLRLKFPVSRYDVNASKPKPVATSNPYSEILLALTARALLAPFLVKKFNILSPALLALEPSLKPMAVHATSFSVPKNQSLNSPSFLFYA